VVCFQGFQSWIISAALALRSGVQSSGFAISYFQNFVSQKGL
jgi:hypothetical protein